MLFRLLAVMLCFTLSGCVFPRATKVPMDSISLPASVTERAKTLIVF